MTVTVNEQNFLSELRDRNPKALEYIINCYSNLVFKVVINVLGIENRESAKECANDIFLLVWNKYHLYNQEKASFKNWLLAVSKYKAIDYKRGLCKKDIVQIEEDQLIAIDNIEEEYILKEEKNRVLQLLEEGDKKDKEIFIRKYIFDENINSIADRLNLSKGAVYNRLWRTRHSLIKSLRLSDKEEVAEWI